jgi:hypothetical protein
LRTIVLTLRSTALLGLGFTLVTVGFALDLLGFALAVAEGTDDVARGESASDMPNRPVFERTTKKPAPTKTTITASETTRVIQPRG